jgi:hypothetical protein
MPNRLETNRYYAMAAGCIALNLAAGKIANVLSLPVYLDSIGIIIAAAVLPPSLALTAPAEGGTRRGFR